MSILHKHLEFVKEQIDFQHKMLAKFSDNPWRLNLHKASKDKFSGLLSDLIEADKTLDCPPQKNDGVQDIKVNSLYLVPSEVEGLPQELIDELSISEGDKSEFAILGIINESGGIASLDRIILGLYRKTGEIMKRQNLTSKLYRMGKSDMVFSVPTKKGIYSTKKITEDEAKVLFSDGNGIEAA